VKSLYNEKEAKEFIRRNRSLPVDLGLLVYTSRLLGEEVDLVLHGGGNTSVKIRAKNILGEDRDVLFVKGSGIDLRRIEPSGFVGLELEPLRRLKSLSSIADGEMENQLLIHKIAYGSPDPSVEALLHAFLPHRFIDHTHAESILILGSQANGADILKEVLGPKAGILPYCHPGFPLAKEGLSEYERNPGMEALAVMGHGLFTFGEDARTPYERMVRFVDQAEDFIRKKIRRKKFGSLPADKPPLQKKASSIARLAQMIRGSCAFRTEEGNLRRFYTEARTTSELRKISLLPEAGTLCSSGVLTPDHAIRTKNKWVYIDRAEEDDDASLKERIQKVIRDYREEYDRSFAAQVQIGQMDWKKLDSNPRIFLVAGVGLISLGFTCQDARIAADIGERTAHAKFLAQSIGHYEPVLENHVWAMEYWGLQQKKLDRMAPPALQGQIALVTGGGGAIGLGIADRLLTSGAAVALSDNDEKALNRVYSALAEKYGEDRIEKFLGDVTRYESVEEMFMQTSRRFGGIDIVVPNAGVAHVAKLENLDPDKFRQVVNVNLIGTFNTIKASIPVFRRQGTGGNVVVVSSKNVFDPGASFGAYSASKAGAHQISKIAALELAELGVRVNLVNPDAVFGDDEVPSKLWGLVGPERMKSRGLDPQGLKEYYRQRNLLKSRVTAEHVGNAVVFFAREETPTTGATLPIDGGIPAAFPR
jgi:rhamnose utilization protein RhaD (predicted bifunctional aldolase and dehydrogenase)/NAD(P)-dependent dehydrogenase (short-subunit alcohol dehydrogenase family)